MNNSEKLSVKYFALVKLYESEVLFSHTTEKNSKVLISIIFFIIRVNLGRKLT